MSIRLKLLVFAVFFGGQALAAQSKPGLTYDVYTRSGISTDTATSVVHMQSTDSSLRMEFDKRPAGGQFRNLPVRDHGVVIVRAAGAEMIMLDPGKKQYMSIKPIEMMEGARKMMESMGGAMTFDSTSSSFQVDSLGPGPTIDGHNTLRYRLTAHLKLRMAMMGEEQTIESQVTSESTNAVDLARFGNTMGPASGVRDMIQAMTQMVGLPKNFLDQATAAGRKMRGFPLHTERQTTTTSRSGSRSHTEITDTRNIRRASIPESAFAIPADYTEMPLPFGPPRVPPED